MHTADLCLNNFTLSFSPHNDGPQSGILCRQAGRRVDMLQHTNAKGELPGVNVWTKLAYGLGAASTAIKSRILGTFLLIFYNQVLGLPPAMVGMAIMIATIFDAVIDPIVGQVSDTFRSRWGRRHPFMYIAAIPTSVGFLILWNPPAGYSHHELFIHLLACLLVVRLFDTFFEVPSSALAPEMVKDYDGRTTLMSIRIGFALAGGLIMILAAYQVFMPENPDGSGGITERAGYLPYSIVASAVIFITIMISALGTHHLIPHLSKAPEKGTKGTSLKNIIATLSSHAFIVVVIAGMLYSVAMGVRQALEIYFYLYFWQFDQAQISVLTIASIPGSLAGVAVAPWVAKRLGKKLATISFLLTAMIFTLLPPLLRILGILPGNESPFIFPLILVETTVTQFLLVAAAVFASSMLADVVEETAVKTGQRSEGLLLSADNLFKKIVSGVGVFVSGLVLAAIQFPSDARDTGVSEEVLRNFGLFYIPAFGALFIGAIVFYALFRIDRARHEQNLAALELAALNRVATNDEVDEVLALETATSPRTSAP